MKSEAQIMREQNSPVKRKSLLVQLFKNSNFNNENMSPKSQRSGDSQSLTKSHSFKTPTNQEKEQDRKLYKQAFNAIIDTNYVAINQVIDHLQSTNRTINSSLKKDSFDGKTLIHLVAETLDPNDAMMRYIIEQKGADFEIQDSIGNNALHLACKSGKLQLVKYFEAKGLNLSQQNKLGDYSMIFAAQSGNLELVKYLCQREVMIALRNSDNRSALDVAYEKSHLDIADFLSKKFELLKQ